MSDFSIDQKQAFSELCHLYGLKPDDLGKTFGSMTLIGLAPFTDPKRPFVLRSQDGLVHLVSTLERTT